MIRYYALYQREAGVGPAVGVFAVDGNHALRWDHRSRGWVYDSTLAVGTGDDPRNSGQLKNLSRGEADNATVEVTRATGYLPDEETIRWIFQWKGKPPQSED